MVIILIGPSGAGKSTVGRMLADDLKWPFHDGDDFHSPENIARMRSGQPLTDTQRGPWLAALADIVARVVTARESAVLACSALTHKYRERLVSVDRPAGHDTASPTTHAGSVRFVYLQATPELLAQRLAARVSHFFPPALLENQLEVLEAPGDDEPAPVTTVDASASPHALVATIRRALHV